MFVKKSHWMSIFSEIRKLNADILKEMICAFFLIFEHFTNMGKETRTFQFPSAQLETGPLFRKKNEQPYSLSVFICFWVILCYLNYRACIGFFTDMFVALNCFGIPNFQF